MNVDIFFHIMKKKVVVFMLCFDLKFFVDMITFLKNTTLDGFGKTLNRTCRTLLLERGLTAAFVCPVVINLKNQCL